MSMVGVLSTRDCAKVRAAGGGRSLCPQARGRQCRWCVEPTGLGV